MMFDRLTRVLHFHEKTLELEKTLCGVAKKLPYKVPKYHYIAANEKIAQTNLHYTTLCSSEIAANSFNHSSNIIAQ